MVGAGNDLASCSKAKQLPLVAYEILYTVTHSSLCELRLLLAGIAAAVRSHSLSYTASLMGEMCAETMQTRLFSGVLQVRLVAVGSAGPSSITI